MISIKGLRVSLGERLILDAANLAVAAGETVALMGASGSGKSTLLRAAVGLLEPERGEVRLDNEPVYGVTQARLREIRRKVGMLFQGNALFDSMNVFENIGFVLHEVMGLTPREVSPRVKELLSRLHLGPIGRMYPAQLSGGMKKRVGIARAVAHDPRIIFYDDPTAGLDPVTSEVIAELIAEISEKAAALVVSNYLPLVMKVAYRVTLLHRGRIIELGPPEGIFSIDSPELREFLETEKPRGNAAGPED